MPPPRALLLLWIAIHAATAAVADPIVRVATRSDEPNGRAIYERVLQNRFDSFLQRSSLVSGDRAGNEQQTRLDMWYRAFRDADGELEDGITVSKTVVRYTHPFDIRHSGYLVIQNLDRPSDQFVYRASRRRIQRVNLRKEAVFGTDFSFEDLVPREIEDADYTRDADALHEGGLVYVVTAVPKPKANSEYSRFQSYIDPQRWIPLRIRYWDTAGVEIKELRSSELELHANIWVPMRSRMRNLRSQTWTQLVVEQLQPNVEIARREFDMRALEGH